jgi:hypothetical protein
MLAALQGRRRLQTPDYLLPIAAAVATTLGVPAEDVTVTLAGAGTLSVEVEEPTSAPASTSSSTTPSSGLSGADAVTNAVSSNTFASSLSTALRDEGVEVAAATLSVGAVEVADVIILAPSPPPPMTPPSPPVPTLPAAAAYSSSAASGAAPIGSAADRLSGLLIAGAIGAVVFALVFPLVICVFVCWLRRGRSRGTRVLRLDPIGSIDRKPGSLALEWRDQVEAFTNEVDPARIRITPDFADELREKTPGTLATLGKPRRVALAL